ASASTSAVATAPDTTRPGRPSNLSATAVSSSRVLLSWRAPPDVDVAGYRVYRESPRLAPVALAGIPAAASYGDTALAPETAYLYRVRAVDTSGNLSGSSNA